MRLITVLGKNLDRRLVSHEVCTSPSSRQHPRDGRDVRITRLARGLAGPRLTRPERILICSVSALTVVDTLSPDPPISTVTAQTAAGVSGRAAGYPDHSMNYCVTSFRLVRSAASARARSAALPGLPAIAADAPDPKDQVREAMEGRLVHVAIEQRSRVLFISALTIRLNVAPSCCASLPARHPLRRLTRCHLDRKGLGPLA
jgi:hypothetical protein